jgi:uncharacterized protein with von Willebrand factor type A (vWA) domain
MEQRMRSEKVGGIVHVYQKFNPSEFPSPTSEPPDLVSGAFEHALTYGSYRQLTEEELANAVHLDPSQIAGLGPSLDSIRKMLEERKRKILETYSIDGLDKKAAQKFEKTAKRFKPPNDLARDYQQAVNSKQLYLLEQLWYRSDRSAPNFSAQVLHTMEALTDLYEIEELHAKYQFTGDERLDIPSAIETKKLLEKIDEILRQIEEASKNAQLAVIDMESLSDLFPEADLNQLNDLRDQISEMVREQAERQGLERGEGGQYHLTPQAYKAFQSRLLDRIFSGLTASRSGRHEGRIIGDGSVELPSTKPYEFGDSIANLDTTQSILNAAIKRPGENPIRLRVEDLEVYKTKNTPKCASVVIMDMSGSMRYDGQYRNVKRMALALQGLITTQYPGDFLRFVEMYSVAKMTRPGEILDLMPKPVTIHNPVVRLKADMSDPRVSEYDIPTHFTNIQHSLRLARQNLASADTVNKQIVLITDGLPTAHFENETLFLLYPPDIRTERETMREAMACAAEGIRINIFLVPSWSQSEEDIRFAHRMAEQTKGRVFFTAGNDLDRFVLWDYVDRKREIL